MKTFYEWLANEGLLQKVRGFFNPQGALKEKLAARERLTPDELASLPELFKTMSDSEIAFYLSQLVKTQDRLMLSKMLRDILHVVPTTVLNKIMLSGDPDLARLIGNYGDREGWGRDPAPSAKGRFVPLAGMHQYPPR